MGWEYYIDLLRLVQCNTTFIFNAFHLQKYINEFGITHLSILQAFFLTAQHSFRFKVILCMWALSWSSCISCCSESWLLGSATEFDIFSNYLVCKWLGPLILSTNHFPKYYFICFSPIKWLLFPLSCYLYSK